MLNLGDMVICTQADAARIISPGLRYRVFDAREDWQGKEQVRVETASGAKLPGWFDLARHFRKG